jgi:hypothetical protein
MLLTACPGVHGVAHRRVRNAIKDDERVQMVF